MQDFQNCLKTMQRLELAFEASWGCFWDPLGGLQLQGVLGASSQSLGPPGRLGGRQGAPEVENRVFTRIF